MSIADKLTQLATAKQNIKQAIIDKGVDLTDVPFTSYHTKIAEISGEGGSSSEHPPLPLDNKHYIYINLTKPAVSNKQITLYLALNLSYGDAAHIDWGDGTSVTSISGVGGVQSRTHTYAQYGKYVITCWKDSEEGYLTLGHNLYNYPPIEKEYLVEYIYTPNDVVNCNYYKSLVHYVNTTTLNTPLPFASYGFRSCWNLTSPVTIPAHRTSISSYAFYQCYSLKKIICEPTVPPTMSSNSFSGINQLCKIYVPDESVEAYKTATNWVTYADYIHPMSEMEGDN